MRAGNAGRACLRLARAIAGAVLLDAALAAPVPAQISDQLDRRTDNSCTIDWAALGLDEPAAATLLRFVPQCTSLIDSGRLSGTALTAALLTRAQANQALEHFAAAVDDLSRIIALDRDAVDAYATRAHAELRLGRLDDALADYGEALRRRPGWALARFGRAAVRSRLGDRDGAAQDVAAARRIDPDVDSQARGLGLTIE
jgi:tetratricopeptide (TPR) repeat protein